MKATPGSAVALRPLRWVLVCLISMVALGVSGCFGGDDKQPKPSDALGAALAYFPTDSGVAFVVDSDLENGVLRRLAERKLRSDGRKAIEAVLRSGLGQRGISFSIIRRQLGNPFVAGVTQRGHRVGAIRVQDAAGLRRDVEERLDKGGAERLDGYQGALVWREKRSNEARYAAVDDSELVVAQSEDDLHDAIDVADSSDNLAFDRPFRVTLASLGAGALVRAVGDAQRLLESGDPLRAADSRRVPWVRALGTFTLVATIVERRVSVAFHLATDRVRLTRRDLPLRPGPASPRLHDPQAPASVAVLGPQQLVRFLEQTLRATDPARSDRLETGIDQLRAILRVDLHRDLIDKITSLSLAASSATAFTFEAQLLPGAGPAFRRDLDRAQLFVEGVLGDLLPGTSVEPRGFGPRRVWVVKNRGLTLGRYSVRGGKLVGSVGPAPLPPPVRGKRLRGVSGSAVLRGDLGRIGRLLGALLAIPEQAFGVVSKLGDLTLGVRTDTQALVASGWMRIGQ